MAASIVWQIAQRDYKFGKGKHRSLTKATYDAVGDHFRSLWGKEAGWAHSVLFTADLRAFSERLAKDLEVRTVSMATEHVSMVAVKDAKVTVKLAPALPVSGKENISEEEAIIKKEKIVDPTVEDMDEVAEALLKKEVMPALGFKRKVKNIRKLEEGGETEKASPVRSSKRRKRS